MTRPLSDPPPTYPVCLLRDSSTHRSPGSLITCKKFRTRGEIGQTTVERRPRLSSGTDIFGCCTGRAGGGGPDCPVYTVPRPTVPTPERRPWRSPTGKAPKPKIGCPDNAAHDPASPHHTPRTSISSPPAPVLPLGKARSARAGPPPSLTALPSRSWLIAYPRPASDAHWQGDLGPRGVRTPCIRERACTCSRADGACLGRGIRAHGRLQRRKLLVAFCRLFM